MKFSRFFLLIQYAEGKEERKCGDEYLILKIDMTKKSNFFLKERKREGRGNKNDKRNANQLEI